MQGVSHSRLCIRSTAGALLFLFACCIGGCSVLYDLMPTVRLQVRVPTSAWQKAGVPVSHRVVYPDRHGDLQSLFLPAGVKTAVIQVQRGYNVPVLAYPLGRLPPAGACVSGHLQQNLIGTKNVLPLRYSYGPVVQLLQDLWHLSERCQTVCVEDLLTEMKNEGDGDPWNCDFDRVKGAIVRGRLNRLHVRSLATTSVYMDLPAGDWVPGNRFFQGNIEVDPESGAEDGAGKQFTVCISGLYPGRHLFFSPTSGLELHIYADKKGDCRYVCDSLAHFASQ